MKISRQDSARRRRSPLSLLPIIVVIVILPLLVLSWKRGRAPPQHQVEIAIPASQLGH